MKEDVQNIDGKAHQGIKLVEPARMVGCQTGLYGLKAVNKQKTLSSSVLSISRNLSD